MSGYQVTVSKIEFEGPLDLLLHLIRKNEINIYDIQIAFILKEYLAYIKALQEIDVQVSSEFLAMTGRLILIKSKMLLPSMMLDEFLDDPWFTRNDDPREALIRQLENRARLIAIRESIGDLRTRELTAMYTFRRGMNPEEAFPPAAEADLGEITLTDLLSYYERAVSRSEKKTPIDMKLPSLSLKSVMRDILTKLKKGMKSLFSTLVGPKPSIERVVLSFMAILEMCREEKVNLHQAELDSPIEVERI